jgi:hypothetical protein
MQQQQQTHRPQPGAPAPPATADQTGLAPVAGAFRRPAQSRGGPGQRRLAALAGWAALLGVIGLVVGVRGLVAILVGGIPGWYEPTLITMGLGGIALTAGAFLTVQQGRLPWYLLGAGSAVLLSSIIVTATI